MTQFVFTLLVNDPSADVVSAAIGVDSANKLNDKDIGKPMKLAANNNYVLAADGDDIEGFLVSTEANTVNDGFSFGSIRRNKRMVAQVEAGEAGTMVVGTFAACGIQSAINVAQDYPQVILKVIDATTVVGSSLWRVIRVISGTGVAGDTLLIEKV